VALWAVAAATTLPLTKPNAAVAVMGDFAPTLGATTAVVAAVGATTAVVTAVGATTAVVAAAHLVERAGPAASERRVPASVADDDAQRAGQEDAL
jgi:Na+-translocating ferredoxin:NAD+ oxidoreductase RnfE subunit